MDPNTGTLQGLMPVAPPGIFKGEDFEKFAIKRKAFMGIYDNKNRDYFIRVDANLDTPITDRDIYMYEVMQEADGTIP